MAYKESAYIIVIAIMPWPKRTIFEQKLTLISAADTSAFVVPSATIVRVLTSTFVASSYSSHKRPTKILTIRSWSLSFTDAYVPKLTVLAKLWAQ